MAHFGENIRHQGPNHTCAYRMSTERYDNTVREAKKLSPWSKPHRERKKHDPLVLAMLNAPEELRMKEITSIMLH